MKTIAKKETNYEELKKEVILFISNVEDGNYVRPNRIVPKQVRSSWRFKIKRYYKELNSIEPLSKNGIEATKLLIILYRILSEGNSTMLFVSFNTFDGLGVSQEDYYNCLVNRILASGYTKENYEKCASLLDVPKDLERDASCIYDVFVQSLKTIDNKYMAIEILEKEIKENCRMLKKYDYYRRGHINYLVISVLKIYCILNEKDKGISFYNKNYIETVGEKKIVVLSRVLKEKN